MANFIPPRRSDDRFNMAEQKEAALFLFSCTERGLFNYATGTWEGECFLPPAQQIAMNSKTEQAITLKLGEFSQTGISKILNFIN